MKYLLLLFIGFSYIAVNAQDNSIPLSKIKPISKEEFKQLKKPEEGTIVIIKEEGRLMYFSNSQWYAMKGECYPKPKTTNIDSVVRKDEHLYVYFTSPEEQKYKISIQQTELATEATASPAILLAPKEKKQYTIEMRAFTKCDSSSPAFYTWENK